MENEIILQYQEKIKAKYIFTLLCTYVCRLIKLLSVFTCAATVSADSCVHNRASVWKTFFPWGPSRTILVCLFTCLLVGFSFFMELLCHYLCLEHYDIPFNSGLKLRK